MVASRIPHRISARFSSMIPEGRDSHRGGDESPPPLSRREAIARGREQLMEMVKDWPENFYELTLKDIVEPHVDAEEFGMDAHYSRGSAASDQKALYYRSAVPYSKRKRVSGGKVSPKPQAVKGNGEREWWKKFTSSSDSDSGSVSTPRRLKATSGSPSGRQVLLV